MDYFSHLNFIKARIFFHKEKQRFQTQQCGSSTTSFENETPFGNKQTALTVTTKGIKPNRMISLHTPGYSFSSDGHFDQQLEN